MLISFNKAGEEIENVEVIESSEENGQFIVHVKRPYNKNKMK